MLQRKDVFAPKRKMNSCEKCKSYTSLKEPRKEGERHIVHGICFKDYFKNSGSIYPIHIPETECKSFETDSEENREQNISGQMDITDFPEVMP